MILKEKEIQGDRIGGHWVIQSPTVEAWTKMLTETVEIIGFTDRLDEEMEEWEEIILMWSVIQRVALLTTMECTGKDKVRGWIGWLREKLRRILFGPYKVWNGLFDTLMDMKGRHLNVTFEKTVGKSGTEMYRECLYI